METLISELHEQRDLNDNFFETSRELNNAEKHVIDVFDSVNKLEHIKVMIEKHGFRKELIEISDPFNELMSIEGFPDYTCNDEDLDDTKKKAACEAIDVAIEGALDTLVKKIKNLIHKIKDSYQNFKDSFKHLSDVYDKTIERLKDAKFDKKLLNEKIVKIPDFIQYHKETLKFVLGPLYTIIINYSINAIKGVHEFLLTEIKKDKPEWKNPKKLSVFYEAILKEEKIMNKLFNAKMYVTKNRDNTIYEIAIGYRTQFKNISLSKTEFKTPENCIKLLKEFFESSAFKNYDNDSDNVYDLLDEGLTDCIKKFNRTSQKKSDLRRFIIRVYNEFMYINKLLSVLTYFFFKYGKGLINISKEALTTRV